MKPLWLIILVALSGSAQAQSVDRSESTQLWATAIKDRIHGNWNPPSSGIFSKLAPCKIEITMLSNGEIIEVLVKPPCSDVYDLRDALERAVVKSNPLPVPSDPSLFVPKITFTFRD